MTPWWKSPWWRCLLGHAFDKHEAQVGETVRCLRCRRRFLVAFDGHTTLLTKFGAVRD